MRTIEKRPSLDWAVLGLLDQAPLSGYDLRKTFGSTPLAAFSDSPGAIYPALRRLERGRLIEPAAGEAVDGRRRRALKLTPAGRKAFVSWLRTPPTLHEVEREMEGLVLRLAFMSQALDAGAVAGYLEALAALVAEHLEALERFYAAAGPAMPLSAQLAFESGVEVVRGYATWLGGARRRARREAIKSEKRSRR